MSSESRLAELLARWETTRTAGRPLTAEELCAECPELLPQLRDEIRLRELAGSTVARPDDTDSQHGHDADADRPPETVGGMKVIGVLGRGGMGWVLEAEDPKLRRRVAVKLMLPGVAFSPAARKRFLREARAQAAIEHEHVAPIHAIHDEADPPYLVMPLLKGQTLAARIAAAGGPLPLKEVLRVAAQMATGLAAAHAGGLIHRDVKPSNVWLEGEKGRVKLLDFGLARLTGGGEDRITKSGDLLGTPAYMAPEQAGGGGVDHRADLFSLGCVMYEMATGRRPFVGDSLLAVVTALVTHNPHSVRSLNPAIPRPLAELIDQLLVKNPDGRRPDTAAGVVARLKQIAAELSPSKAPLVPSEAAPVTRSIDASEDPAPLPPPPAKPFNPSRPPYHPERPRRPEPRRRMVMLPIVAVTGLFVVAAVVFVVLFLNPGPPPTTKRIEPPPASPQPPPTPSDKSSPPEQPRPLTRWPFAAGEAKAAQEAWAKQVGRKVEEEIDLGHGAKLAVRLIPPGKYTMGSPDTEPGRDNDERQREVVVPEPFYAGTFEVTQAQYAAVVGRNPSHFSLETGNRQVVELTAKLPVEQVTWLDARTFCEIASQTTGGGWRFRLPTEEEWEWLARAGTETLFHVGTELPETAARYAADKPWEVGSGTANAFGLYDVHGNVWEWCENSLEVGGKNRGIRGGSWWEKDTRRCRSAFRGSQPTDEVANTFGFRVIAEPVKR